ncbi:MAG: hypothetical protein V4443_06785 [Pseudomonadota bacterium]
MQIKGEFIIDENAELTELFEQVNSKYQVGLPKSLRIVDVMAYLASTSKYLKYKEFDGGESSGNFGEIYSKLLESIEMSNEMRTTERRCAAYRSFSEVGL